MSNSEVNISPFAGTLVPTLFLVQLHSNQGVSSRNIDQEQLRITQSCSALKPIKNSLFGFNSNGPLWKRGENKVLCDTVQI